MEWTLGSGGSWDMLKMQPISDEALADLAQRYHYAGTPWNCRSMPLSDRDREYMYLLYSSMSGLVARMRRAELQAAELERKNERLRGYARHKYACEALKHSDYKCSCGLDRLLGQAREKG